MTQCRLCHASLPAQPLLSYGNMPAQAQHLPERPGTPGIALNLLECPECGLYQLDCPPVPYFREVIRAVGVSRPMREFRLRQFRRWLRKYGLVGKKVLECGCGKGEYLSLMIRAGALGFGMDGSAENLAAARDAGMKEVEPGYFETGEEQLANGPFDGFFILNYLEHVPDLARYLRGLRRNLKSGAHGLVEVPNFDMMIRERLFAEFTSDHLSYFTGKTLRHTLEHTGFEVFSCRNVWHDYILSAEVRLRPSLDVGPFRSAETELKAALEEFFRGSRPEDCAVWGAGHQSFALLAWANLSGRISCVIDSAPFKQGKFVPAGTAPIVSPAILEKSRIRKILIMAGSYSEEIASLITKQYGRRFQPAYLQGNRIVTPETAHGTD